MSYHSRGILTSGASRKRKEREGFYQQKPTSPSAYTAQLVSNGKPSVGIKHEEPISSNSLLAGYMAYEYLTKGTLFGQKFDPARAEAVALTEPKRGKPAMEMKKEEKGYAEVTSILKTKGTHLPGIVNPTQLARWIQM